MTIAVFQGIGPTELLIVLGIVLLIFGPKRLPALGRQLGGGMREFTDSIRGRDREDDAAARAEPLTEARPVEQPADAEVLRERR